MLFLVASAFIVFAFAVVRLVEVVRADRPLTPPRSHLHELDPFSVRLRGAPLS